MIAYKVLVVSGGIIVLADIAEDDVTKLKAADIVIDMNSSGLVIKAAYLHIPLPEHMLDFLLENRSITIYPFSSVKYVEEAILGIVISREAIIEARAIYNFWKKTNAVQSQEETHE